MSDNKIFSQFIPIFHRNHIFEDFIIVMSANAFVISTHIVTQYVESILEKSLHQMDSKESIFILFFDLIFNLFSVVTGVRFTEKDKTIYPQIQIGKLLPMATVDQNSVTWLNPPDDRSYFDFGYDRRQILFGDPSVMRFTDSVVTGIFF